MGEKLQFDVTKFTWIGNPAAGNNTTVTWHTSGVKTIEEAKAREVTMGATGGSTSSQFPKAMNTVLGTKFKIITGYPGGAGAIGQRDRRDAEAHRERLAEIIGIQGAK